MKPLDEMTVDDILDESVFTELLDMQDQVKRTRLKIALKERAKVLKVAQDFKDLLSAYEKADKEMKQKKCKRTRSVHWIIIRIFKVLMMNWHAVHGSRN